MSNPVRSVTMLAALGLKLLGIANLIPKSWRIWIATGMAALAFTVWFTVHERGVGRAGEQKAEAGRLVKARADVAKRETKASAISADVGQQLQAAQVQIQYRTRTLIEKVPTYVPPSADARCVVNRGFVLQHDLAASGSPPGVPAAAPGSGPIDAPSGVALSAVLGTVEQNYGTAYQWRAEALAWRSWYTAQSAAWSAKP